MVQKGSKSDQNAHTDGVASRFKTRPPKSVRVLKRVQIVMLASVKWRSTMLK